jgi:tRNA(Ile)-lysidine synthase
VSASDPLANALANFLDAQADRRPLLIALSGGLDSMVLLNLVHLLCPQRLLGAAHFDHAIHPKSGQFCQQLAEHCQQLKLEFFSRRESAIDFADRERISLEAAARQLRYGFLQELATQKNCWVLTAHHRDDVAETLLLKLIAGTSLLGLSGPRPRRDHWLLRPLLSISRAQLETYAAQKNLAWLDDPTNQETSYRRNWVRLELMPLLIQQNPQMAVALSELAGEALELESHFQEFKKQQKLADLNSIAQGITTDKVWPPSYWRTQLAEYWQDLVDSSPGHQDCRISRLHLLEWVGFLQSPGRPDKVLQLPADVQCFWTHKGGFGLRFKNSQIAVRPNTSSWTLEFVDQICRISELQLEIHRALETQWRAPNPMQISLEPEILATVKLRHRRPGDRWGSEKLKKKLIDWQIPQNERDGLILLAQESQILGVIGHRFRQQSPLNDSGHWMRLTFKSN